MRRLIENMGHAQIPSRAFLPQCRRGPHRPRRTAAVLAGFSGNLPRTRPNRRRCRRADLHPHVSRTRPPDLEQGDLWESNGRHRLAGPRPDLLPRQVANGRRQPARGHPPLRRQGLHGPRCATSPPRPRGRLPRKSSSGWRTWAILKCPSARGRSIWSAPSAPLKEIDYQGQIYPEHFPSIAGDHAAGLAWTLGYIRALDQAVVV